MNGSLAFISQIILGFSTIVFYREYRSFLRDFKRLKYASRGLVRNARLHNKLGFESQLAKELWFSIFALSSQQRLADAQQSSYDELVSAGSKIASTSGDKLETAKAIIQLLAEQMQPELRSAAIFLEEQSSKQLKVIHAIGVTRDHIERALQMCFEGACQIPENEMPWGYSLSQTGTIFDFGAFDVGISLTVPIRLDSEVRGGIWLGFSNRTGILTQRRKAFLHALARHAANSFHAAYQIRRKTEQPLKERDFLLGISHDLRAPGNSALYALRDLLAEDLGKLSKAQRLRLDIVENALEDQLNMLGDVLDYTKHQRGFLEADIQECELKELFESNLEHFQIIAERKGLLLYSDQIPDVLIRTDPRHAQRILTNFFSNAIKYTNQGSISLSFIRKDKSIDILLTDTGPGIPAAERDKLFGEFSRLSAGKGQTGIGLGLAVSKMLAEASNATIFYEPNPNGGSIFGLSLSITAYNNKEQKTLVDVENQYSVLLIDDDQATCRLNARYLKEANLKVEIAYSLPAALELIEQQEPDLVITDWHLSEGTALGLIRALALHKRMPSTLLLSGSCNNPEIEALSSEFPITVLEKPILRGQLLATVAKIRKDAEESSKPLKRVA